MEAVLTPTDSAVILLVEDDDRLRQLVVNGLHGPQYWVLSARTGEGARDLISAHSPIVSLLVVEVVLPDTDGLALAARARDLVPDLRVLYMATEDQLSAPVRERVLSS